MTRRLLISYLTVTVVVLLLLEVPLALFFSQREEERFISDAERDAVVLASFYEDVLESGLAADPAFAGDFAQRTNSRVVVVDSSGISVLDTHRDTDRDFSTRPEIETALSGLRSGGIRHSDTLGSDLLFVAVPVASGGTIHGALRLTVDAHDVAERVHQFWIGLVAVAAVILAAVAGIGWAIARSVTRPLRELQLLASRFADGDLSATSEPVDAPPEIEELAVTMHSMASRLDELIVAQRSFVGDASHQLRTPLTALRLRLENLESQVTSDADSREISAAIHETTRLSGLVDDLLRLARAEQAPPLVEVDLAEIVGDRVDTWTALAEMQDVELRMSVWRDSGRVRDTSGNPILVRASPGSLEQILDNLLENALEVSPVDSAITVRIDADATKVTLAISDEGPGLDDESKRQALERFWRGSKSGSGSGLGLSIVQALVLGSGGQVLLADPSEGGLSVQVSYPRAQER